MAKCGEIDESGEIQAAGAGIGGGFEHTGELKVMKYEEAISGPDRDKWKKAIADEHKRMVKHKVWKTVKKADLEPNTKIIDSTWACKKKSNGTLRARMNTRGYKQLEGEMYKSNSIAAPVTNDITIRVVLTLMLLAFCHGQIVDIKGAFLHGHFENGEIIHMSVPKGFKRYYPRDVVLLLLKTLYGLKQAAMAFWRELLKAM